MTKPGTGILLLHSSHCKSRSQLRSKGRRNNQISLDRRMHKYEMHKYEWEKSLVATIGDNTIPTPNVLLNPDPSSQDQLGEFALTIHNFSSQVRNFPKEHLSLKYHCIFAIISSFQIYLSYKSVLSPWVICG